MQDYLDLEPDPTDFIEELNRVAPELMAEAEAQPNTEVSCVVANVVQVGVTVEVVVIESDHARAIYVRLAIIDGAGVSLPMEWLETAIAAFLPAARWENLDWDRPFPGSHIEGYAVTVCWCP